MAVIPARGGSKGIPKKNLKKINGKSLIQIVSECSMNTKYIDEHVISSDSDEIIKEAKKFGLKCYFRRPNKISGDMVPDIPVLQHALIEAEKYNNYKFDIVLMLQPTSPLRQSNQIEKVIKKIVDENLDSVWTVHLVDKKFHPDKQLKITKKGLLNYFTSNGEKIIARQQLNDSYIRNGVAYAITRKCLVEKQTLMGTKCGCVILDGPIVNIDTIEELKFAKKFI